jgi:glycosyltransferase involved in cell wall biosynthesis
MKKKNILIFVPMIGGGGVEKNLFIIANYLSEHFKNVSIISTSKEFKSKFNKNIKFISPKSKLWNKIKNRRIKILVCLYLLAKEIIFNKKWKVLSFQGNLYCCLLCKVFKTKVILRSNASITGWSKGYFKKVLYNRISKMADKIIVNSLEFQKEYIKHFNLKTKFIYNPLNKDEIIKNSKRKINFSFFKKKTFNFINIGRLVSQKNQLLILKSFKLLSEKTSYKFKLLIIGSGEDKKVLLDFINKNNLQESIKVIKFRKNPFPYLRKTDAFVLASIFEGLPNVLLEALTFKKLVISSDCPTGPKEILDHGKGGLIFKMNNEFDLYKKIIFFIKNKSKCQKLVAHGFNRLTRFDYRKNLNEYIKIINSLD